MVKRRRKNPRRDLLKKWGEMILAHVVVGKNIKNAVELK
jgi:hypothetical protein